MVVVGKSVYMFGNDLTVTLSWQRFGPPFMSEITYFRTPIHPATISTKKLSIFLQHHQPTSPLDSPATLFRGSKRGNQHDKPLPDVPITRPTSGPANRMDFLTCPDGPLAFLEWVRLFPRLKRTNLGAWGASTRPPTKYATRNPASQQPARICVRTLVNALGTLGRELHARSTASALHPRTYLRVRYSFLCLFTFILGPAQLVMQESRTAPTASRVRLPHVRLAHLQAAAEAKILPSSCSITAYSGISTSAASTTTPTHPVFIDNSRAQHLWPFDLIETRAQPI
ncbi:hypothetical protein DFH08DRAFT_940178 [Mycena albidolilacea]|uniref:Uncharacterized protein n=1 Tax=Mycena albidolilacea TaxID=1033008 RepID=A0AAD7EJA8_9AGAR|nr:hypothetical protein DFH08DRAFT_940178 [Mycena albidolilacea]